MLLRIFLLSLLSTSAFAIRDANITDQAELPESVCQVDYTVGTSPRRHCNGIFVSPTQILYPPLCDPDFYPGNRLPGKRFICYELQPGPAHRTRIPKSFSIKNPGKPALDKKFVAGKTGTRSDHNFALLTILPEIGEEHSYMEPVTDRTQLEKILKEASTCRVVGRGGIADHFTGRTIPAEKRLELLQGDQIVMDQVQENGELGAPFYCTVKDPKDPASKGKDYLLGMVNYSKPGLNPFKKNGHTFFSLMPEAADFLKQQNITTKGASAPAAGASAAPGTSAPAANTSMPATR